MKKHTKMQKQQIQVGKHAANENKSEKSIKLGVMQQQKHMTWGQELFSCVVSGAVASVLGVHVFLFAACLLDLFCIFMCDFEPASSFLPMEVFRVIAVNLSLSATVDLAQHLFITINDKSER